MKVKMKNFTNENGLSFIEFIVTLLISLIILNTAVSITREMKKSKERAFIENQAEELYQLCLLARDDALRLGIETGILFENGIVSYVQFNDWTPKVIKQLNLEQISVFPGAAFTITGGESFTDYQSTSLSDYIISVGAKVFVFKGTVCTGYIREFGFKELPNYKECP